MARSAHTAFLFLLLTLVGLELVSSQNICLLNKKTGPCRANFPRYYFDRVSGLCTRFVYGGCRANRNNFRTIQECKRTCGCTAPPQTGRCMAMIPRYYFDQQSGLCYEFMYGGCGANENNFRTEADCLTACS
ncbi:actinia tenebrosa protease inhibitors-like [Ruditapes philippinarum]|uniref:actinia tenebrosa protease inhibitors-like n=1 Tax=Ruditapes philippinarum TaxID=129788 RepID=UPI00295AA577|nr:actinia tenebrosa protease inhibitors-like [Ruditapes philippinarum]